MSATSPLALINVGTVPPRGVGFSSRAPPSVVEVLPGVYLIATIAREKNRCVFELLQPAPALPDGVPHPSARTNDNVRQRCLSNGVKSSPERVSSTPVPEALRCGFRVPRVIQLVTEDEGVIETVALVREPLRLEDATALERQESDAALAGMAEGAMPNSIDHVHVHFFIGTSNGTVLVGNALRGTILAVAQFQYHHRFSGVGRSDGPSVGQPTSGKGTVMNQSVVKFVVSQRSDALRWNPSLPFSQLSARMFLGQHSSPTSKSSVASASLTADSCVTSVYVAHSGGKVVELSRAALDVFVRVSVDRLDGHRPHLILEWSPESSTSTFPVAGPASEFAAHVSCVSVLAPSPASYSDVENCTASAKCATAEVGTSTICDADIVRKPVDGDASPLLYSMGEQGGFSDVLLVGGANPLFSSFRLQPPPSGFSASNTLKAVKKIVAGAARSLWLKTLGTSGAAERPPHLKKVHVPRTQTLLQADAKCTTLQVDPTQQWAALAIEGGGRIYVMDVQSWVVAAALKGCRSAQFTWWWTELAGGRPALLLVVHLPLRRIVEVYTTRTWHRLAARYVPNGSVLLRPSGVPSEVRRETSAADGQCRPSSVRDGNGTAALLMDPAGNVFRIGLQWVLDNPLTSGARLCSAHSASLTRCVGEESSGGEASMLSPSVLRSCQTPNEFLELALQLPLPQPRVQRLSTEEGGCVVAGGDEVRTYLRQLSALCEAIQRRFAPAPAEIAVIPIPSAVRETLDGILNALPHAVTAAQCLHYVHLYASLVENYYRLLTCKDAAATLYFDPQQWTSALVTPDLWRATFCTSAHPGVADFLKTMDRYVATALAAHPTELSIYKRHMSAYLRQVVMRDPPPASNVVGPCCTPPPAHTPYLACPTDFMTLPAFMRCFYVGSARPTFLRGAVERAEDADGSVTLLGPLSDLVFGIWGVDSFVAQLPALRDLGCTDSDVAHITVSWIARQASRDLAALLSSTTVGCLAATLLSFSDDHFAGAVARAPIPFVSVDGDLATHVAVDSVAGLLWCCAVRLVLRPPASSLAHSHLLVRRVRQLLQLWLSLSKVRPPSSTSESAGGGPGQRVSSASDDRVALFLRLRSVEPARLPGAEAGGRTSGIHRGKGSADDAVRLTHGDVMEVYLQHNGIAPTLLDGFVVPRADADADAARLFPVLSAFVALLGEAAYASDPDVVVVESLPWIDRHQWDEEKFRNDVLQPLEQLWRQLSSPSAKGGFGASKGSSTFAVYEACLILVAITILQHILRPLTDIAFFFWETNAVPDGNFFPVDGTPSGLLLSGSRTTRDYLTSLQRLASLLERMLLHLVAPLTDAERALLIQKVSLALAADDALLFPLVPQFLRLRLTIWMQVLSKTPRTPLRRTQRVRRLVELILFFTAVPSLTVGGVPLTQLQSHLTIPWRALLGGPSRRAQLQLLPTAAGSSLALPTACRESAVETASLSARLKCSTLSPYVAEEDDTGSASLNPGAAATVLRQFLAAGGVLYANRYGPTGINAADPTPCLGLIAEDTRRALARLSQCLGIHERYPDIADVVLMDYEIKHLFPVAAVEQEMLRLSSKSAAPQVAASNLQSFLVLILQHLTARCKGYAQRGDSAAYDAALKQLRGMAQAVSGELRAWLQELEDVMTAASRPEKTTKGSAVARHATSSSRCVPQAVPAESVLSGPDWVTPAEHREMGRLVSSVLSQGKESAAHKNFFHMLFTLSQWACEGRLQLPSTAQRVARELPLIVKKWEKVISDICSCHS
ncbi:hypothetical protein LSCM1_00609 [Leishmania martiniquensis]|uniref:Rab3-GAP regulatory subunit N-terminal domain-containing protein n=1 Tax=Leishmania martiniquensis TaxID=1580590 RepID=A0A836KG88_9TRYP|nr:hypothetical protein LSCM1_00609 [Leishmania martiniquensis]